MAFLRRPADLDRAEWLARWQGGHTRVAIDTQSTFGYVQNVVVRALTPGAPAFDGIVEELFPAAALTDFHVFFDTGGSDAELGRRMTAMTESVARFSGPDAELDVVPTSRYVLVSPVHPAEQRAPATPSRRRAGALRQALASAAIWSPDFLE